MTDDYWMGIATQLSEQVNRLEQEKVELALALLIGAGGRIEVSKIDLIDLPDLEVYITTYKYSDSVVYATRRRRRRLDS